MIKIDLLSEKKIYLASDFHLGAPDVSSSLEREKRICKWLDSIKSDAQVLFLVGDIFDFWFEYKYAIPKGFIRFQGKIAELVDAGIQIEFFTGNHDMWMFDYFTKELGIKIHRKPISILVNNKKLFIGHGDGLGPGDFTYKFLKRFFASKVCQWLFARIHPNLGMGIAHVWSSKSRLHNHEGDEKFFGQDEWLLQYCRSIHAVEKANYYIFGHRHFPMELKVAEHSTYINLGEWISHDTYVDFDGERCELNIYR